MNSHLTLDEFPPTHCDPRKKKGKEGGKGREQCGVLVLVYLGVKKNILAFTHHYTDTHIYMDSLYLSIDLLLINNITLHTPDLDVVLQFISDTKGWNLVVK